jgi:hypothetical protein
MSAAGSVRRCSQRVAALSANEPQRPFSGVRSAIAEDFDSLICRAGGMLYREPRLWAQTMCGSRRDQIGWSLKMADDVSSMSSGWCADSSRRGSERLAGAVLPSSKARSRQRGWQRSHSRDRGSEPSEPLAMKAQAGRARRARPETRSALTPAGARIWAKAIARVRVDQGRCGRSERRQCNHKLVLAETIKAIAAARAARPSRCRVAWERNSEAGGSLAVRVEHQN